jgi:transcription antitermination protein NusB
VLGSRREGREAALQVLYLKDIGQKALDVIPDAVWANEPLTPKTREFAESLVEGVLSQQSVIDPMIKKYTANWEMSRMAAIDRSILRLAAYELLHELETPINVIINEAVEIAKKFSTGESSKFVNGILDKIKMERK